MRQRLQESEVTHQDWEARQFLRRKDMHMPVCVCPEKKYVSISLRLARCTFAEWGCSANVHGLLEHKTSFYTSSEGVEPAGEFKYIGEKNHCAYANAF